MTSSRRVHPTKSSAPSPSEEFFRETLAAARVGIWTWDIETGEIVWSHEVERLFGLEPGAFAGTYDAYREFQHPEDLARVEQAIAEAIRTHADYDIEHRVRRADGTVRWVQGRGRALYDEAGAAVRMAGTVVDITDKKESSEHAARMQFTIDRAGDAVFWHDRHGRFIYANQRAREALGYSKEEIERLTVLDVAVDLTPEAWESVWRRIVAEKTVTLSRSHRRKDGTTFPVEINVNYVDYDGDGFGCAFARDVSERHRAEEERKLLEAQILDAKKMESIAVLAGGIAHDFNNLLVGILGSASVAASQIDPASPIRERLDVIQKAASRASDLAMQMLAYSGKATRHVEPLSVSELVSETVGVLEHSLSDRAELHVHLSAEPLIVQGDATQLRQIVMNLLTNASDALAESAGTITLSTRLLDVGPDFFRDCIISTNLPAGRYVVVEVADDGSGIPEESRPKIFDPFFTTKFAGRGLGLAVVLGIVKSHGGTIQLTSTAGEGTRFQVLFPALDVSDLQGRSKEAPVKLEESSRQKHQTVLIVDDEEMVRGVAAVMLEKHGFQVLTASDGHEALELVAKHGHVAAVLLDMTMPRMNGEETQRALREVRPSLPVVLSSGYGEQDAAGRFRDDPPDAYVQKPYRVEQLVDTIRAVVDHPRQRR